jgi:hypothetical protein
MKQFLISFFLIFIVGFGLVGQNYHYSGTTDKIWNADPINIMIEVTSDSLQKNYNTQNHSTYGIYFSYITRFFEDGVEKSSNYTFNFYDLQIDFICGSDNTNHDLKSNYDNNPNGSDLASNNQELDNPSTATLASMGCDQIKLLVHGPGINETVVLNLISTLPIELITFDAVKQNRDIKLSWATAGELNNDYFTIERSADGISWETVHTLPGSKNSSQVRDYSWIDDSPFAGISYYRLKQTDYDGKSETFNIVSVEQNQVEELQAYPNPVSHTSTLFGSIRNPVNSYF